MAGEMQESSESVIDPQSQQKIAKLNSEIAEGERKVALAALARLAEKDLIPENELEDLYKGVNPEFKSEWDDDRQTYDSKLERVMSSVPTGQARETAVAYREGTTTRTSPLRETITEIARLSDLTHSEGRVRSWAKRVRHAGAFRRLAQLRGQPIINQSLQELEKAENKQAIGRGGRVGELIIRGRKELLEKSKGLTMGDLYDVWGQELVRDKKNSATILRSASANLGMTRFLLKDATRTQAASTNK